MVRLGIRASILGARLLSNVSVVNVIEFISIISYLFGV